MDVTTIEVGGHDVKQFVTPEQYISDVSLDDTDLNDAFLNQAALMAYYGTLHAKAQHQAAEFKRMRDATQASLATRLRDNPPDDKKLTENAIAERVERQAAFQNIVKAYNAATEVETMFKHAIDAMKHRKDMVVQLGAKAREEYKGSVVMKATTTSTRGSELKKKLAGL